MTTHQLRLDPIPNGWTVSGAVSVENSKTPTADAVHTLVAVGKAGPSDSVRVQWQGAPIVANVGAVTRYRPSAARLAVDRSGALHHHFGKEFSQARPAASELN